MRKTDGDLERPNREFRTRIGVLPGIESDILDLRELERAELHLVFLDLLRWHGELGIDEIDDPLWISVRASRIGDGGVRFSIAVKRDQATILSEVVVRDREDRPRLAAYNRGRPFRR